MSFNQTRGSTRWSISTFLPFAEPPLAIQNRRLRPRSVSMLSIIRQLAMNESQSPLTLPFPDGKGKTSCHSRRLLSGIHLSPFSCRHVHENILPSIARQLKNIFIFNRLRFIVQIFCVICQLAMNESQSPLTLPFPDGKGKTSCHSRRLLSGIHLSPFSCRHVRQKP